MLTFPIAPPVRDARPAYRPFRAVVAKVERLTPHFTRVTFTGDDLHCFGTDRRDQRVKIVFPIPGVGISDFGCDSAEVLASGTWYSKWRELPDGLRNPFRTYTIRDVRPDQCEVDVDFVAHGDGGPAAHWLLSATAGDEVVLVGPDRQSVDSAIGIDFHPGEARDVLLAGDETAAPAICAIVETLPDNVNARAFIEVPTGADILPVARNAESITWLPREHAEHGARLEPTVTRWVQENPDSWMSAHVDVWQPVPDTDVDSELIWDSPQDAPGSPFYAWLAGEAAVIKRLRRLLVTQTGIDRRRVAFMGYWRLGRPEAQ
jgi:NADPH-dependent ferric siderophore reductase